MNIAAMEGRLNRIRARVGDVTAVEIALQQFEAMSEFGEEISRIAHQAGLNVTHVEELVAEATSRHLEVLAEVYDQVSEHARPAIESVMSRMMMRHQRRVQELEQWGANVPPSPAIPESIQERLQERMQEQEGLQEQQQEQEMEGTVGGTTSPGSGVSNGEHGGK